MGTTTARQRRQPERSVLYRLLCEHLRTFLLRIEAGERTLPGFVVRELEAFLRCGILAHGFCRVHCDCCGRDELVAFSCKRRGFCPSCTGRRMADLAAHLVDSVLPDVPYRQWVLSLPFFARRLCAYDASLCTAVRRVMVRAVNGFYLRRRAGLSRPRCGAVVFVQRFDSALKLNVHLHGIWADGLFDCPVGRQVDFHAREEVTDGEVGKLVASIRTRVLRLLRKRGLLPSSAGPADDPAAAEPTLLDELSAAAVQGRTALGRRRGCQDVRIGRGSLCEPFVRGPLCADVDGFSLHAAVVVPEGARLRLEKLCRYAARPPLAEERLSVLPDGKVVYKLKKRWRDGSTHVVLEPLALIERLCALVPPPRKKLLTYHGVFAPAASARDRVVPAVGEADSDGCRHRGRTEVVEAPAAAEQESGDGGGAAMRRKQVPHGPRKLRIPRSRYSWAELMRRVFLLEVLVCPSCHGRRRVLAGIFAADAIRKILTHLGLPCDAPEVAPARPPPQARLPW